MLQAELRILGGKHQGKAIPLSTKKFLVGREQDCHLRPNSDLVSRHHCVFSIDDYAVRLRDLGSTNGTRVNGKPLHGEVTLKAGDKVGIGKLELELVVRQRSAAEMAVPATTPMTDSTINALAATSETATVEIGAGLGDVPTETSFELPTHVPLAGDTSTSLTSDTAILPTSGAPTFPAAPMQVPAYPQQQMPAYPQNYQQPMGYPGQQMGYPGQPMGYPQQMAYPQYPQYPQYAQPAYQGMPGYPMQMDYSGAYQQGAAAPAAEAAPVEVRLPPPESTGVKAPAPAAPTAAGGAPATEEKPSNTAADIIKQYMQKRTR